MAELGSHQMDVANWFLGTHPKRVFASGGIEYFRDGREVYDNISCLYEYELKDAKGTAIHGARELLFDLQQRV